MTKTSKIAALVVLTVGMTGCEKKAEPSQPESGVSANSGVAADMAMSAAVKTGSATGTVTNIGAIIVFELFKFGNQFPFDGAFGCRH